MFYFVSVAVQPNAKWEKEGRITSINLTVARKASLRDLSIDWIVFARDSRDAVAKSF